MIILNPETITKRSEMNTQRKSMIDFLKEFLSDEDFSSNSDFYQNNQSLTIPLFNALSSISKQILFTIMFCPELKSLTHLETIFNPEFRPLCRQIVRDLVEIKILTFRNPLLNVRNENCQIIFSETFKMLLQSELNAESSELTNEINLEMIKDKQYKNTERTSLMKRKNISNVLIGNKTDFGQSINSETISNILTFNDFIDRNNKRMTKKGFELLFLDSNSQNWWLIFSYITFISNRTKSNSLKTTKTQIFAFILKLSQLNEGKCYKKDILSFLQKEIINDLSNLGFLYQKKKYSKHFYPTKLIKSLSDSKFALTKEDKNGFLVLETNFKVYAYTNCPVQIFIIGSFAEISKKLRGFVSGTVSRNSFLSALKNGISTEQIISFIEQNGHFNLSKSNDYKTPKNVTNQLRLWESQLNRYTIHSYKMFSDFRSVEEFNDLKKKLVLENRGQVLVDKQSMWILAPSSE